MRRIIPIVLAAAMLALPAPVPAVIVVTGHARIAVDDGCLARLVQKGYKVAVKPGKKMELPVGTYRITARPATCEPSKKKITVRKGKTVRASVIADSRASQVVPVPARRAGQVR
ncbi:MAG: hypothetical protein IPG68_11855 [Micrococcales bacterium]|nr:hypothetical protein [Micrococcales bacterium]